MPDASGAIPPVRVPSVPWLERYERGDGVRVAKGIDDGQGNDLSDVPGRVVFSTGGPEERSLMVELDEANLPRSLRNGFDDTCFMFSPGELRRLS